MPSPDELLQRIEEEEKKDGYGLCFKRFSGPLKEDLRDYFAFIDPGIIKQGTTAIKSNLRKQMLTGGDGSFRKRTILEAIQDAEERLNEKGKTCTHVSDLPKSVQSDIEAIVPPSVAHSIVGIKSFLQR